jgi:hypothetical protein
MSVILMCDEGMWYINLTGLICVDLRLWMNFIFQSWRNTMWVDTDISARICDWFCTSKTETTVLFAHEYTSSNVLELTQLYI